MSGGGRDASTAGALARAVRDRWPLRALAGAALLSLLLVLAIGWIDAVGTRTDQRVALTFLINLVAVLGIQVFMGNSGVPTFGHVAFVAIGGYAAALLTTPTARKESASLIPDAPRFLLDVELGLLPALLVALVLVVAVALAIGVVLVRLKGGPAAIGTLALLMIVTNVIANWSVVTRGPKTWAGIPDYTTTGVALAVAVAALLAARAFRESGLGLRLRATRTDELAAGALGVDVVRARLAAWVLSAAIAGAAGVLWATYFASLAPQTFFLELTFVYLVMVIVGGPTVSGAVLGAAVVTLVSEWLRRIEDGGIHVGPIDADQVFGLTTTVLGLIVLLTIVLRPGGILGRWELDEWIGRGLRRARSRRVDGRG